MHHPWSMLLLLWAAQAAALNLPNGTFVTYPRGFFNIPNADPYMYGPTISLVGINYVALWCSPGVASGQWDSIRMAISPDLITWQSPTIALTQQNGYDANSVCDPSLVAYRGQWFLYHTCINTVNPPDGYKNNRICVAVSDSVDGPYYSIGKPVIQDLSCPNDSNAAYCVGQPSAIVHPTRGSIWVYYTNQRPGDPGPNPGRIYVAESFDGVSFTLLNNGSYVYPQRDVDVKYNRVQSVFTLVQGDVGGSVLTYASSSDGINFTEYDPVNRIVNAMPLSAGETNNNPGLVGMPDGSFDGMTQVVYASGRWAQWLLATSPGLWVPPTNADNCTACTHTVSCDRACANSVGSRMGLCEAPGSINPKYCCQCVPYTATSGLGCQSCVVSRYPGCVSACRASGRTTGVCSFPGGTNYSACCHCFS